MSPEQTLTDREEKFYEDFIHIRSSLRDFPAIPRKIIDEHLLLKGYKKTNISKHLKSLRKNNKIKYIFIADEYGPLGWRGRDKIASTK